jgi:hypothetical protein
LNKLATQSGRNWKRRFFILTPLNIAYYVSEEPGQKPKGELQILADSIVTEEKVDAKQGFGFKFNNGVESIVIAASTELDRSHWIQTLRTVITSADNIMRATVTVLSDSTVLLINRSAFSLGAKTTKKYIVIMDGVISVHPDKETTTTIEGVLNVNAQTKLKVVNEKDRVLTLVDSDFKSTTLSIRFDCDPSHDPTTFLLWKRAIDRAMTEDEEEDNNMSTPNRLRPSSARSVSSNSTTGSVRKPVAAPASSSNNAQVGSSSASATANNSKTAAVLQGVEIFGLSFDHDNEDDEDDEDTRSSISSAPSTASSTGGVQNPHRMTPSAVPHPSSVPAASASASAGDNSSTTSAANTKLSALNRGARSFLRKRASKMSSNTTSSNNGGATTIGSGGSAAVKTDVEQVSAVAVNPLRQAPQQHQQQQQLQQQQQQQMPPSPPSKSNALDMVTNPLARNQPPAFSSHNNNAVSQNPPSQLGFLGNVEDEEDDEEEDESAATAAFLERMATKPAVATTSAATMKPPPADSLSPPPPPSSSSLSSSASLKTAQPSPPEQPQPSLHVHVYPPPSSPHPHHPPSAHSHPSSVSPLHKATHSVPLKDLVGEDEVRTIAQQVLPSHAGKAGSLGDSIPQTQQMIARPVQEFLTETNTILHSVIQQLELASRQVSLVPVLSVPQREAADASLVKLRSLLRESVNAIIATPSSTSSEKSISSAFQQLEQEKQLMLQLLEHIQQTEEQAMQQIHLQEVDALKRIRKEAETVQQQFDFAHQELRQARSEHEEEMERRLELLEKAKQFLDNEQRRLDGEFRQKMRDIALIARDLAQQHALLQSDRKKMLKSRYQLDLAMQDLFRGTSSPSSNSQQQPQQQYHSHNVQNPAEEMKSQSSSVNYNPQAMMSRQQYAPGFSSSSSSPGRSGRTLTRGSGPQNLNRSVSPANSLHSGGGSGAQEMMRLPTPVTQQMGSLRSTSPAPTYTNYPNQSQFQQQQYSSHPNSRATTPTSLSSSSSHSSNTSTIIRMYSLYQ